MKKDQQFSLVSCKPAPFTSLRIPLMTFSSSSSANNSGISPEASRSLITTRNFSSGTWASVRRNTVPTPFRPALMYNWARSAYMYMYIQANNSVTALIWVDTKGAPWGLRLSILSSVESGKLRGHWHRQPDGSSSVYHCHQLQQAKHCLEETLVYG